MNFPSNDWRIIGHKAALSALQRAAGHGSPAHAYLLTGPSRAGKRTLAVTFAAALNCLAESDHRPCFACTSCRQSMKEEHPDLIVVERQEDKRLSVEQIRGMRSSVDWKPYQGRFKIYVVVDVEDMSEGAANALLKTLEEPPSQVVLILTATSDESVPATVRSRCYALSLQLVMAAAISDGLMHLHSTPTALASRIGGLARGRPGWAVAALSEPDLIGERERAVESTRALASGPLAQRLMMAGSITKGENFLASRALCLDVLDDLYSWWRDLLYVGQGLDENTIFCEYSDVLRQQSDKRGRERIIAGLRDIQTTSNAVERNVTPRLALEALLLRLG